MPCRHAIAAMAYINQRPEDHCHGWLTLGSYKATYEHFIKPTQGVEFWEVTDYDKPVPPVVKRRPGRPKRSRRKDGDEQPVNGKLRRTLPPITCSRCGNKGHNRNGCPLRKDQPAENPPAGNQPAENQPANNQPAQPQQNQHAVNQQNQPAEAQDVQNVQARESQTEIDVSHSQPQSPPQTTTPVKYF